MLGDPEQSVVESSRPHGEIYQGPERTDGVILDRLLLWLDCCASCCFFATFAFSAQSLINVCGEIGLKINFLLVVAGMTRAEGGGPMVQVSHRAKMMPAIDY